MILSAACILYTQDLNFVRRTRAFLRGLTPFRHVDQADRLDSVLQQNSPALLLLDLRARESRDLLAQVQVGWPNVLMIGFGMLRSDPLREAEQAGIYAVQEVDLKRRDFQALVGRALDHLRVLEDNRAFRAEAPRMPAISNSRALEPAPEFSGPPLSILRFPRVFRRFENTEMLVNSLVEGLADAAMVTRIGLFFRRAVGERYRLIGGLRCLPESHELEYSERDPLVRWFELHAHLICRAYLAQTPDHAQRELLRRALDSVGAEVIVPLQARGRVSGWLFFGHRLTGQPFDDQSLEALMILGDHASTVLENALLNEEVTLQKTLAETLLAAIPPGIIASDEDAIIRWFNPSAESILGLAAGDVLNKPIEYVGSHIASLLRETLESTVPLPPKHWIDPRNRRSLSVQTRRLIHARKPLGAVAVIQDRTPEESLRQRQELMDRAAFWTDLAASMSHEVRNPLVAIKTFAQLLPERFDDADFRRDFNEIVVQEIDRLDLIITQINNFAHPPELNFKSIDLRAPMKKAVELVRARSARNGFSLETTFPDDLPRILGDETALTEVFAHLVANAAEATHGQTKAKITLSAQPVREGDHTSGVVVTVRDNGTGITADLKDKIFSPFCTTKARGMGLGLPIVKRTVFDHNGRVDITSDPHGTSVKVLLPVVENEA
ncbi:MAG TPA: ATP-binding protein [Chthoniobacterales bacterium]|nr:ATP-binding protein [Chthoniobacterales bacterium]